ncbi:MAG: hypothetical protein ACRD0I_01885 [Acidimicrobiales bacterium]
MVAGLAVGFVALWPAKSATALFTSVAGTTPPPGAALVSTDILAPPTNLVDSTGFFQPVTLNWTASIDPHAGTYNVLSSSGAGNTSYSVLAANVAGLSYVDTPVTPGFSDVTINYVVQTTFHNWTSIYSNVKSVSCNVFGCSQLN